MFTGTDYTGELPDSNIKYGTWEINKRSANTLTVKVFSPYKSTMWINSYVNTAGWSGWDKCIVDSNLVTTGTWTPKIYDYNTYIKDAPAQTYYKIGNIYLFQAFIGGSTLKGITISELLELRNFPVSIIGASGFLRYSEWTQGNGAINFQLSDKVIYFRSGRFNAAGGTNATGTFTLDTGLIQVLAIGIG